MIFRIQLRTHVPDYGALGQFEPWPMRIQGLCNNAHSCNTKLTAKNSNYYGRFSLST